MGCRPSKLDGAEDSIHVILSSEKKKQLQEKQGAAAEKGGYVPRRPHPKVQQQAEPENGDNLDKLMYHAANHNDSVDKRDLEEYGGEPEKEEQAWERAKNNFFARCEPIAVPLFWSFPKDWLTAFAHQNFKKTGFMYISNLIENYCLFSAEKLLVLCLGLHKSQLPPKLWIQVTRM